ncbi:transketolase, partial [Micromonospora azadirachtae]
WTDALPEFPADAKGIATRAASSKVLDALAPVLPELWGGSADLAESNNTTMKGEPSFIPASHATKVFPGHEYGRTLHFGIREHAMGAILNGIALHGGTRPYGGTFLVFSDYMRPSVRLAALMKLPVIYVWTHDSIGLGEDGPTHQPVEHLSALRAIPGLDVVRPADANETAWAWR